MSNKNFLPAFLLTIFALLGAPRVFAGTACMAPAFAWLSNEPVTKLMPVFKACRENGVGPARLATRQFVKGKIAYYLLVDPDSLQTSVEPQSCQRCDNTEPVAWGNSRFMRALTAGAAPGSVGSAGYGDNVGLRHALRDVEGYFVTVDLCPSRKQGFDEDIFTALEVLSTKRYAPPVGISISGAWIKTHRAQFDWLREQEKNGLLRITWVNHTLTHPYNNHLPNGQNFLLGKGVNVEREVLGLEKLLLENGVVPSVFFRFPGLIGNAALIERLRDYALIPIGADAWLAKRQSPVPGSIILIHGNENEEDGVVDFLKWFERRRHDADHDLFLGLDELVD